MCINRDFNSLVAKQKASRTKQNLTNGKNGNLCECIRAVRCLTNLFQIIVLVDKTSECFLVLPRSSIFWRTPPSSHLFVCSFVYACVIVG